VKIWLIDTGPLIAYLDRSDPHHEAVAACLESFTGRLVTTGAVVTEAMHFLAPAQGGPDVLAGFVAAGDLETFDYAQPSELRHAADLMAKYGDLPMDYADATLVLLGTRLGVADVLTLDRRGFGVFRLPRRKRFRLVLDER
jgi:uncharacterized protein